jgi:hypothetical protein
MFTMYRNINKALSPITAALRLHTPRQHIHTLSRTFAAKAQTATYPTTHATFVIQDTPFVAMDAFEELERLAYNASQLPHNRPPSNEDVNRWVELFSYFPEEATKLLEKHRQDVTRTRISDDYWEMIQYKQESKGHDKGSYEHQLSLDRRNCTKTMQHHQIMSAREARNTYLIKLEGLLSTPEDVQAAANMPLPPSTVTGEADEGDSTFCIINGKDKCAIISSLSSQHSSFSPYFIRIQGKAHKNLSEASLHPTLGIDITLPQNRPETFDTTAAHEPTQDEFPVYYFFYGTLSQTEILSKQISRSVSENELMPALISGGTLATWGKRYKALVDGRGTDLVRGYAFLVQNKDEEDGLRMYETDNYEVVRCHLVLGPVAESSIEVKGLTFRFCGAVD